MQPREKIQTENSVRANKIIGKDNSLKEFDSYKNLSSAHLDM